MISYKRLPGGINQRQELSGISDWFGMPSWVKSYWQVVKSNVANIRATGPKISQYFQRISLARQKLIARGDQFHADALNDELKKVADDMQKWSRVNGYLDTYLAQWTGLDDPRTNVTPSGVGFVPLVLGAVAITALAYVVNVGMALYQDYQFKSQLTQAVIDQKITSGQMKDIISVPREEGILEKVVSNVGLGVGIGVPSILIVGGGLYLLFTTGMLNTILRTVGLRGDNTQSSGG